MRFPASNSDRAGDQSFLVKEKLKEVAKDLVPLAQWIEHLATNQEVGGSNPSGHGFIFSGNNIIGECEIAPFEPSR